LREVAGGVRVAVRLTPRARADRIDGMRPDAAGHSLLCVSVTAPPAENQANDALLRVLAREWRLPQRDIAIVGGHKSREKLVHIAGDAAAINARLAALLGAFSE
jgi:uncharacterized protein (TIGR00251 family)